MSETAFPQWQRRGESISTEVDGALVLLVIESGKYVTLNASAQCIWEMLENAVSEADIVERLQQRFDVDADRAHAAAMRTLDELAAVGIARRV